MMPGESVRDNGVQQPYRLAGEHIDGGRYRAVFEQASDGVFLFDGETGVILEANAAFANLLGYSTAELLTMSVHDFLCHDRESVDGNIRRCIEEGRSELGERRYLRRDGSIVEVEVSIAPISYAGRRDLCAVVRDVTGRKLLEERLRHEAYHDPLTNLPNRTLFGETLEQTISRANRRQGTLAMLFVDLDDFKEINDSFGHVSGDFLLVGVAERLRGCVRAGDLIARIGGDEFIVLLGEDACADPYDAVALAERILECLRRPFAGVEGEVRVTASIGIHQSLPPHGDTEDMLRRSDAAMYRAKERGKARYEMSGQSF